MTPPDQANFIKRITISVEDPGIDRRSAVLPLERPIEIEGSPVLALRLKGVFPQTINGLDVESYARGLGFCDSVPKPARGTRISVHVERPPSDYSPLGTMSFARLKTEVETALALGAEITEPLLGFGVYEGLRFCGEPVGFAVYGMERKDDLRFYEQLSGQCAASGGLPEDFKASAAQAGRLLRRMHNKGLAHGYPHLSNFRVRPQGDLRLLDLDTAVPLLSLPRETRIAFLYLDLSRTMHDYFKYKIYKILQSGHLTVHCIPYLPLLPHFLRGYFDGDTSLEFARKIKPSRFPILSFGRKPDESDYEALLAPRLKLCAAQEGRIVDLQDFRDRPFFDLFYRALESVA